MSLKKVGLLAFFLLLFAGGTLWMLQNRRDARKLASENYRAALQAPKPFNGALWLRGLDDFRVGHHKVVMCGTALTKSQAMREMALATARQDIQGKQVKCKPVGTGTPCDGKTATKFGDAIVVQCFLPDGTDLASRLIEVGLLCGLPAHAGSAYTSCQPG